MKHAKAFFLSSAKMGKKGMVTNARHVYSLGGIHQQRERWENQRPRQSQTNPAWILIQLGYFEGEGTRQKQGLAAHIGGGSHGGPVSSPLWAWCFLKIWVCFRKAPWRRKSWSESQQILGPCPRGKKGAAKKLTNHWMLETKMYAKTAKPHIPCPVVYSADLWADLLSSWLPQLLRKLNFFRDSTAFLPRTRLLSRLAWFYSNIWSDVHRLQVCVCVCVCVCS